MQFNIETLDDPIQTDILCFVCLEKMKYFPNYEERDGCSDWFCENGHKFLNDPWTDDFIDNFSVFKGIRKFKINKI